MLPVTDPAAAGAKFTLNALLWPAGRLSGRLRPEMLKPAPVTAACVMFSVTVPVLATVAVCDWLLPTFAAMLTLVGVTLRLGAAAATPVPVTGTVTIPPEVRSTLKERFPEKVFAESGRKATWYVTFCPDATVTGNEGPVSTNSGRLLEA
jgi:hypothetical protein